MLHYRSLNLANCIELKVQVLGVWSHHDDGHHLGKDEDREAPHGGAQDGVDDGQGNHSTISSS